MKQKTKNGNDHLNLGWAGAGVGFIDINKRFVHEAGTEVLDPDSTDKRYSKRTKETHFNTGSYL